MSQSDDENTVRQIYPHAYSTRTMTTGGCRISEFKIRSGEGDNPPVGPSAFTEAKAWRYASERIEVANGKDK